MRCGRAVEARGAAGAARAAGRERATAPVLDSRTRSKRSEHHFSVSPPSMRWSNVPGALTKACITTLTPIASAVSWR
ncbi:uncharacterized protein ACIB01_008795 isoform 3-T3 [Guaruba guarouba]